MPTHTRIRMFNTKDTYPNQSLDNDLCQAVRAGNTVYVRGQIGTDFEGNLVGLGDPQKQAEQAMKTSSSCWRKRAATCRTSSRPPPTSSTRATASPSTGKWASGSRACFPSPRGCASRPWGSRSG